MSMRVPENALRGNVMFNMARAQTSVAKLSEQIASGKRLLEASDDPVAFVKAKSLRGILNTNAQYQQNIGRADDWASVGESAMASMQNVLFDAKDLAMSMANDTVNAGQRADMAVAVQALMDELIGLGNTQVGGRYIFSGNKTDTPAFAADGTYQGDSGVRSIEVGEGIRADLNIPGDQILASGGALAQLTQLKAALIANDQTAIAASITPLSTAADDLSQSRMVVGLQLNKLETRRGNLEEITFQTERLLGQQEDVDMNAAVSELVQQQNTLEVTRSVLGQIMSSPSLMEFLR
jgi:flagellar hook-associated protein 3 FlgL